MGVGVADDLRQVAALLLLLGDHLHAHQVAVERHRAVEVGDGVPGVVERAALDHVAPIAFRSSRPPSGVTRKMFSTRAPDRPSKYTPGSIASSIQFSNSVWSVGMTCGSSKAETEMPWPPWCGNSPA